MSADQVSRSENNSRELVPMLLALLATVRRAGTAEATWGAVPPEERQMVQDLVAAGLLHQSAGEDEGSVLTLTDMGRRLLAALPNAPSAAEPTTRPTWQGRVLSWGEHVVKRYRHEAENQWPVLDKFEQEGWPKRIADPFAGGHGHTKKRRRETVESLNREQEGPVRIVFHAVACGSISWERRDAEE